MRRRPRVAATAVQRCFRQARQPPPPRHLPRARGCLLLQALVKALPYVWNLTALGLASTEVGYPPQNFKNVYRTAGLLGLHKVAHAGAAAAGAAAARCCKRGSAGWRAARRQLPGTRSSQPCSSSPACSSCAPCAAAGEEGGPDYVWSAIRDLGVQRVDHGIRRCVATADGGSTCSPDG